MSRGQPNSRNFDENGLHSRRNHLGEKLCLISLPQVAQRGKGQPLTAKRTQA